MLAARRKKLTTGLQAESAIGAGHQRNAIRSASCDHLQWRTADQSASTATWATACRPKRGAMAMITSR